MRLLVSFLFLFVMIAATPALAAKDDPVVGTWEGSGWAHPKSGTREGINCQVNYRKGKRQTYIVRVTCSHVGGVITSSGHVNRRGKRTLGGTLHSDDRSVRGAVTITINSRTKQTVTARSPDGKAKVTLYKQ